MSFRLPYQKYVTYSVLILLSLLALFICFYKLGNSYLENWDEGFYAEVTKQMLRTKDFIVLHWNGTIFLDKPPLNLWLNSVFASIFGLNEFSIRITSAISGFLVILIVLLYSYKSWGLVPSLLAFSAIALNNIFIWRTRTGNLDTLASLLILVVYLLITRKPFKYKYLILGIVFALIFLQKASLVFFPLLVYGVHELTFNLKDIKKNARGYISLLGVFSLIVGIWLLLGTRQAGSQFYNYYLFKSDQGVAHIALANFNWDYILHLYYSLQRRFFYVFVIGLFFLIIKIYKPKNLALLLFSTLLVLQLSFTEKNNNWYIVPALPFAALVIAYGTRRVTDIASTFIHPYAVAIMILLPTFYVSFKTFKVNIMSVINSQASVQEVNSAHKIKQLSKPTDRVMRLDFAYPVTLYYSDRRTFYYTHIDESLFIIIRKNNIRWIVGKKEIVNEFISKNKVFKYRVIPSGEEDIVEIL